MDDLGRAFLQLAVDRNLLTVEQRDQVEAACARAQGEKHQLTPWRAAFVRGHLSRAEVDRLLADASAKVEAEDGDSSVALLGSSAEDEALDHRLGVLALQMRVVTDDQLEHAVAAQRRARKAGQSLKLGDALVQEALVSPAVMEGLLILQERVRETGRQDSTFEAIAADLRFGQVALDARLVTERDVERALAEQKRRTRGGKPVAPEATALGNLLVELGAMSREARDLVLELQERRSGRAPAPPPTSRASADEADKIGRMLVESRVLGEQQVEQALALQREIRAKGIDRRLGDLLVLQGAIDRATLDAFLKAQVLRRKQTTTRRRRSLPEELLPEHPLTVLLGAGLALILVFFYVLAVGGLSAVRGARAADSHDERRGH